MGVMWAEQSGGMSWGFGVSFGSPWWRWSLPRPAAPLSSSFPPVLLSGYVDVGGWINSLCFPREDFKVQGVAGLAVGLG